MTVADGSWDPRANVLSLVSPQDRAPLNPTFTKAGTTPLLTAATGAFSTIYWPWILRVSDILAAPLDAFYLWYSTDHDAATSPTQGKGGIALKTAPAPGGPWTDHGMIYRDTVAGRQTETPAVIYNETTSRFHMYYQQEGVGVGQQSTILATSVDGVNWIRLGIVLDVAVLTDQIGVGHTGYFRPFRIGDLWVGYCLQGIAYSDDGLTWQFDARPLAVTTAQIPVARIEWNHMDVVEWGGRLHVVGLYGSGAGTVASRSVVAAPLADDFRHTIGRPRRLFELTAAWESGNVRSTFLLVDNGISYLYYQCDDKIGLAIGAS